MSLGFSRVALYTDTTQFRLAGPVAKYPTVFQVPLGGRQTDDAQNDSSNESTRDKGEPARCCASLTLLLEGHKQNTPRTSTGVLLTHRQRDVTRLSCPVAAVTLSHVVCCQHMSDEERCAAGNPTHAPRRVSLAARANRETILGGLSGFRNPS